MPSAGYQQEHDPDGGGGGGGSGRESGKANKRNRPNSLSSQKTATVRIKTGAKRTGGSAIGDGASRRTSAASVTSRILSSRKQTERELEVQTRKVTFVSTDLQVYGLKVCNLSFHGLTQVPADTFRQKDVGELDLSENNLRSIPPEIQNLQQLRILNLTRTSIRASSKDDLSGLPKELCRLPYLHGLAISECNLRYIPPAIFLCLSLRQLDISRNKLLRLPPEIGNLVNLELLRASETGLTGLPPEIAYCERLQDLDLYGNTLETLPETLRELHDLRRLKLNARSFRSRLDEYVVKMIRSGQIRSEHLPPVLFEMPELESLDLDGTQINSIPERCACRLLELSLSNNYFLSLPKGLRSLTFVEKLDLSGNSLNVLPDDIGAYMPSVRRLSLARNLLDRLPPSISELSGLLDLDLSNNRLSQLPAGVGALRQLRVLRLRDNRLSSLPDAICDLSELQTLDLSSNSLTELPVRMHELRKIVSMHSYSHMRAIGLWLHKNPISEPPEHIWKTVHVRVLFTYLRKLQIRRTENLQPLKIIVLGEAGCGKTSLIKRLITGRTSDDPVEQQPQRYLSKNEATEISRPLPHDDLLKASEDTSSTTLIDIKHWRTENDIRICSLDFGGSSTYKQIHAQLLDPKALYLLAFDARQYNSKQHFHARLGCWLDMLSLHASGCVVKIVATRADKQQQQVLLEQQPPDDVSPTRESNEPPSEHAADVPEQQPEKQPENQQLPEQQQQQQVPAAIQMAEEHIAEYLLAQAAQLENELQQVEKLIDDLGSEEDHSQTRKEDVAAAADILGFDPQANLVQLQRRKAQISHLLANPMRKMNEIANCGNYEDLLEVQDLAGEIERLAINKKLFPHAQSFVPTIWRKLMGAIKKKQGFFVTWEQVAELAAKYKLYDDYLIDCLSFMYETGDVIWLADRPTLRPYVFHQPRKLVAILKGIINHSMPAILDYDANKALSSFGKLSREQFEAAKGQLRYGEISRHLLLSFWFYLQPSYDELHQMCEVVYAFELGYLVPQPDAPSATAFKEPFLIIPAYISDDEVSDVLAAHWPPKLPSGHREIQITYRFPVQPPTGAFERLSTRLQETAQERLDWQSTVYICHESGDRLLVRRHSDSNFSDSVIDFKVRSQHLRSAHQTMARTHKIWSEILGTISGLIWMVSKFSAAKKE